MANFKIQPSCTLENGYEKSATCNYSLNKVSTVYLANFDGLDTVGSGHTVTGVSGSSFYKIVPEKDSASFTDELQVTDGGAKYRTHTVTFSIGGDYTDDVAELIDTLSLGRFTAVAELANGNWIMLGRLSPLEATVQTITGAASASDASAYEVTLVGDCAETVSPLSSEAIAAVKGA